MSNIHVSKLKTPLQVAIELAGSQKALADKCGVRQQSVFLWLKSGKIPSSRAIAIEKAVGGKVTRSQLRPDLYPLE